jgi:hypothetical protein
VVLSVFGFTVHKTFNHKPTTKITRQAAYAFPDDIVYFSQDISVAYHTVPLGFRRSPSAYSIANSSFGFVGANLPINNTAESPREVD